MTTAQNSARKREARGGACFAKLLSQDPELSTLRAEYSKHPASQRRAAAEWAYNTSVAEDLIGAAIARLQDERFPDSRWPAGFAALAIDPNYGPALFTVGCHEYACGRKREGLRLLCTLTHLPPDTPDWTQIIEKSARFLIDSRDAENACSLYQEALKIRPHEQELLIGMG